MSFNLPPPAAAAEHTHGHAIATASTAIDYVIGHPATMTAMHQPHFMNSRQMFDIEYRDEYYEKCQKCHPTMRMGWWTMIQICWELAVDEFPPWKHVHVQAHGLSDYENGGWLILSDQ